MEGERWIHRERESEQGREGGRERDRYIARESEKGRKERKNLREGGRERERESE